VVANVIIAEVDNVLQVPNRAVQTSGDQKFVYVWSQDQNSYVAVQVKVGLASDTMTEVSSDQLKEGAEILVSVPTTSTNSDNFRPGGMIGIGGIGR
jgi:multidrug efflux pump subunit AcrA (membrane-fusion protein)